MMLTWTGHGGCEYTDTESGKLYAVILDAKINQWPKPAAIEYDVTGLPMCVAGWRETHRFATLAEAQAWVEQTVTPELLATFAAYRAAGGNPNLFAAQTVKR